jgi:hypothetical protein
MGSKGDEDLTPTHWPEECLRLIDGTQKIYQRGEARRVSESRLLTKVGPCFLLPSILGRPALPIA